ncbi:MAG: hypothetical protein AB1384_14685 [Actinomycetota bacterium]
MESWDARTGPPDKEAAGAGIDLAGLARDEDRVAGQYRGEPMGPECALVEIAGRDSIAAAIALAKGKALRLLLPSIVFTATEYGDTAALFHNAERLRRLAQPLGVEVANPVVLGSPRWWRATIGRVNSVLSRDYGPWHICVGCHMYLHAVRAPLAWEAGIARQVGGERLGHGGKVKINQTRPAVEAYRGVLAEYGIDLELPLLEVDDEDAIRSLAGDWEEGEGQPGCVLSGNYRGLDGEVDCDHGRLRAYLDEYLVPVTRAILRSLRERGEADYDAQAAQVLGRLVEGGA